MESCEMRHCWKCFECILRALLNSDCSLHQKKQNQPTKKKKPKPKTSPHPRFYWGYGKLFAPCRLLSWVPVEILSQIKTLNLCKNWVSGFEIAELIWLPKGEVLLFFFRPLPSEGEGWVVGFHISWSTWPNVLNLLREEKQITEMWFGWGREVREALQQCKYPDLVPGHEWSSTALLDFYALCHNSYI